MRVLGGRALEVAAQKAETVAPGFNCYVDLCEDLPTASWGQNPLRAVLRIMTATTIEEVEACQCQEWGIRPT
eukprot:4167880-Lingulodinium_polyedra.AAC.1